MKFRTVVLAGFLGQFLSIVAGVAIKALVVNLDNRLTRSIRESMRQAGARAYQQYSERAAK